MGTNANQFLSLSLAHWLAVEGVQPSIPQNPTSIESRSQELVPKGPGANPALAALAGNDNVQFKPSVKHIISKELILYFEKIQTALLDETPDEEVMRLREAALESVRSDPGLHQLVPYFVTFVSNQVTHHLDSPFVLRQMMELAAALVANEHLFLDPYASALSSAVLTCLLSRKLGASTGDPATTDPEALRAQFQLREFSASLVGHVARKYARSNSLLRPQLTRTCLKYFLDPSRTPAVLYGAILGLAAGGGPEVVRLTVLPNLRSYDAGVLQPLKEKASLTGESLEFETLVAGIMKAVRSLGSIGRGAGSGPATNGINGGGTSDHEAAELVEFIGPILGERVAALGDHHLNEIVLGARGVE